MSSLYVGHSARRMEYYALKTLGSIQHGAYSSQTSAHWHLRARAIHLNRVSSRRRIPTSSRCNSPAASLTRASTETLEKCSSSLCGRPHIHLTCITTIIWRMCSSYATWNVPLSQTCTVPLSWNTAYTQAYKISELKQALRE